MLRIITLCLFASVIFTQKSIASTKNNEILNKKTVETQSQNGWHKADPKRVCMVTDMEFPRDQIPVQVKDKTYYGCCENCKDRLGKDEGVRQAKDPISGKMIDKAKASIAAGPDGSVVYFENDKNLETYVSSQK